MEDFSYNVNEKDLINANERFRPTIIKKALVIDKIVSEIVGKDVLANDSRLIKLIVGWKKGKAPNDMSPDNFLQDQNKIEELKQTFI